MSAKPVRRSSKAAGLAATAIASRIKQARVEVGMSQTALAEAIGVTFQQVQKYERVKNRVSSDRLQRIADALHKPITYFFFAGPLSRPFDAETFTRLAEWANDSRAGQRILARLPLLGNDDSELLATLIERMTAPGPSR